MGRKLIVWTLLFIMNSHMAVANSGDSLLSLQEDDRFLGNKDAPVVIIEYSSLSCPHCASLHKQILPQLKEDYISKGKILYIMRDFPSNPSSLAGAKMANCADNYFDMLGSLFESQEFWAFGHDYRNKLKNISHLAGMSPEDFHECMDNKELEEDILRKAYNAAMELHVLNIPTLFINKVKLEGLPNYERLQELINKDL